ncbi:MAG: HAD hydrolase-like protein [Bacteroidetes bacterium]|nr:HAD hydrolase-like protein [Bacteroidota bacterium]
MKTSPEPDQLITTLFVDIGGVLLTNGWGHQSRKLAAETFGLHLPEVEARHHLTFETYEVGKLTLNEYFSQVIFHESRSFTIDTFRNFMFAQTKPFPDMIALIKQLKEKYQLKIVVVSNEGREMNAHRIETFRLTEFVDCFISSSFVHFRKPDADIFRIALDIAQVPASQVFYIDDQPMFVSVAEGVGIQGVCHIDYQSTCAKLGLMGLKAN